MKDNTNANINKVLEGETLKEQILKSLKEYINNNNLLLSFTILSIGDNSASKIYIKQKEKMAKELGIACKSILISENINTEELLDLIFELNKDDSVNGIIMQLPIPDHLDKVKLLNAIDYKKDIDGLNNVNLGKLMNNEKGLYPATALGIVELFKYYNISLLGKNILIINRSILVGKPLALMLINEGATVTVAHSKTVNLNNKLKDFDIIISAAGKKNLIKEEFVREDTVLIDVGVTRIDNKIYGDIEENLKKKRNSTPTIGGVGPLTIAMLANNIVEAYKIQNNIKS